MKRNITVLVFCAVLLALCAPAGAQQQKKIPRIGYLALNITTDTRLDAFRQGLRQLGYVEGKDIFIESRTASGKLDRLDELAGELVRLKVDVIVTRGPGATRAAKAATATIPIVMTQDPIRWPTGSSPVLRTPAGTSRAYQTFPLRQAASKWSF